MIDLPWPPKELSPNARVHWTKKAKAAKAYRMECFILAKASGVKAPTGRVALSIEFVPPDRRRRDDDNCLACFKAGRDGIADALGIDDSNFVTTLWLASEPVKGGMVRVTIGGLSA